MENKKGLGKKIWFSKKTSFRASQRSSEIVVGPIFFDENDIRAEILDWKREESRGGPTEHLVVATNLLIYTSPLLYFGSNKLLPLFSFREAHTTKNNGSLSPIEI